MKKLLVLVFIVYGKMAFSQESNLIKIGDSVPSFSFEIEKGKMASIADYKGKLVLINLFATWCPPCRKELPEMQKQIWDKHKNNPKFALFVFGREEGWDVLVPFKKKFNYTFPILPDEKRDVFGKFATQSIPRNILIDETGKIIYQSIGYEEKEFKKLIELIDKRLEK
ncbi:TlpA family protein disulfide reductase [Niabella ginsengisoli]|uniref:TlpA family protein disulfide reductase n=1 Tax=Niabella ginsengisoli TaxID=522298 RepID=A0ABS9SPL6_9BACT|nr:TlpA disulfide reductase family protein [Niabella ginsengisoli]MCH5600303.1 TlpA family protein disulfide reductase [Niabella ginsengisoli]